MKAKNDIKALIASQMLEVFHLTPHRYATWMLCTVQPETYCYHPKIKQMAVFAF